MIYGKDKDGVWHIALQTFPSTMHAKCGLDNVEAVEFQAPQVTEDRPVFCIGCVPPRNTNPRGQEAWQEFYATHPDFDMDHDHSMDH